MRIRLTRFMGKPFYQIRDIRVRMILEPYKSERIFILNNIFIAGPLDGKGFSSDIRHLQCPSNTSDIELRYYVNTDTFNRLNKYVI